MYALPVPPCNAMADYDWVSSTRNPANEVRLVLLRSQVAGAYRQYQTERGFSLNLSPLPLGADDSNVLYGNFDRMDKGKPCDKIRFELLATTQSGQCPYCRLEDATTLDHILERTRFPEFSVLRTNLAPVCPKCNTIKQNNAHLMAGRGTHHLYYAGFPTSEFLVLNIKSVSPLVEFKFSLTRPAGMSAIDFDALQAHFDVLDLAARYGRRARVEMQDRRFEMQRLHKLNGPGEVADFLQRLADSAAANWSDQDWLAVLLSTAANDSDFCDRGIFLL